MMSTRVDRSAAVLVASLAASFVACLATAGLSRAHERETSVPPQVPVAVAVPAQFDPQGRALEKTAQEGQAPAEQAGRFSAQGERISEAEAKAAAPVTPNARACLELHNGPSVTWNIDVTFNANTYPYAITGGTIKGTICGSPNWVVTGGSMGSNLIINAKRTGGASSCANTVSIVGSFRNPPSYAGTYGFDGSSTSFPHTTLYCCGACPAGGLGASTEAEAGLVDMTPEAIPDGDQGSMASEALAGTARAAASATQEIQLGFEIDQCSGLLTVRNRFGQWITVPRGRWTTIDVAIDGDGYWYWRCGSSGERSRGAPNFRPRVKRLKVFHSTESRKITWWCYDLL
jgi:hypothetical protein